MMVVEAALSTSTPPTFRLLSQRVFLANLAGRRMYPSGDDADRGGIFGQNLRHHGETGGGGVRLRKGR